PAQVVCSHRVPPFGVPYVSWRMVPQVSRKNGLRMLKIYTRKAPISRRFHTASTIPLQPMPHPRHRHNVARARRPALELAAEVAEVDVDEVGVVVGGAPDGVEEVGVGEDFVGVDGELAEELEFGFGERDLGAGAAD